MSGSWTWPPTSTLHLFPESVLTVFLLLLQLRAKIHWIEMNKHWLPDKLMLKEWLMNIADAMHSNWKILLSFDAKAHTHTHTCTHSLFLSLRWTTAAAREYSWDESLSSRLSLVAIHQCELSTALVSDAVRCWLYPVRHAVPWQVGTYLDTHTHWIKRRRMRQQASPRTEQSGITFWVISKSHPLGQI